MSPGLGRPCGVRKRFREPLSSLSPWYILGCFRRPDNRFRRVLQTFATSQGRESTAATVPAPLPIREDLHVMPPLLESHVPGYPLRRGKVRDVYDLGDRLVIVA